jgi:hypothetical protein
MLFSNPAMNRRHFLKHMAGLSLMAGPAMQFVQGLRAAAPQLKKEGKSLIILWMGGGPSTIDLWDLKPDSPNGGEFKPSKTSVSGIEISQHLPTIGKQMQHLLIVRSLSTTEGDHNRGTTLMSTGRSPSPVVQYPHIGSVVSQQLTAKEMDLPGFISVGGTAERIGPGFLGMMFAPFTVQNPGQPPANLKPPSDVAEDRVRRRQRFFNIVEDDFRVRVASHIPGPRSDREAEWRKYDEERKKFADPSQAHAEIYGKAFSLAVSPRGKVFDLRTEDPKLAEEYGAAGTGANNFGRGCLLARKLVDEGVTCVEVDLGGWDNHNGIFPILRDQRLPVLDKGMGTLIRDLNDRGQLKNTVVVWMGEFGRTPRINQNAGRDHWPGCWSVVIGGGAIKGGQVYGATDKDGLRVADDQYRCSVQDLFATIFKGMGLDPSTQIRDNLGRPMAIAGDNFKVLPGVV